MSTYNITHHHANLLDPERIDLEGETIEVGGIIGEYLDCTDEDTGLPIILVSGTVIETEKNLEELNEALGEHGLQTDADNDNVRLAYA